MNGAPLPASYQALVDARENLSRMEHHVARLTSLEAEIGREQDRLRHLEEQLARERADVDALTSLSLRSVLARLRGTTDEQLASEQADVQAVELELGVRREALDQLLGDTAGATAESARARLPGARRRFDDALMQWEAEQVAAESPVGLELGRLGQNQAVLQAQLQEVDEARTAGQHADAALAEAERTLSSAANWSTYDTFFGGGMISGMTKHNRIDEAAQQVAAAQHWMLRLNAELADLSQPPLPTIDAPSATLRTMDVWFDNLISDWMVHDRVKASQSSITASRTNVARVMAGLDEQRQRLVGRLVELGEARTALLLQLPGEAPPTLAEH